MDVATHILVPYAAALAALGLWRRDDPRKAAWAAVFGVAGAAPDLDGGLRWLVLRSDSLWWLQHRGFSHSLFGAPVFALVLVGALALAARRWPRRLGLFAWQPMFAPMLVLGSWTHLILDGVTLAGVPLLFPFSERRFSLETFHWLVDVLFPVSALVLILHAFGRLSRRRVAQAGALVVLALVAIAGARLVERPADAAHAYPRASFREWIVVERLGNGTVEAQLERSGVRSDPAWYPDSAPPEAADAITLAESTDAFRGFLLGAYGPLATHAELAVGGGWNVTFIDAAQRYEAQHEPGWTPTPDHSQWGLETFLVRGGVATETHRGW